MCTLIRYMGFMGHFLFHCSVGCFQHDCLDTCCLECLTCMCFCIFVFAPVQCNWACSTWKGALEIRSLLSLQWDCIWFHKTVYYVNGIHHKVRYLSSARLPLPVYGCRSARWHCQYARKTTTCMWTRWSIMCSLTLKKWWKMIWCHWGTNPKRWWFLMLLFYVVTDDMELCGNNSWCGQWKKGRSCVCDQKQGNVNGFETVFSAFWQCFILRTLSQLALNNFVELSVSVMLLCFI